MLLYIVYYIPYSMLYCVIYFFKQLLSIFHWLNFLAFLFYNNYICIGNYKELGGSLYTLSPNYTTSCIITPLYPKNQLPLKNACTIGSFLAYVYWSYVLIHVLVLFAVSCMNKHAISTIEGVRGGSSVGTALDVQVVDQGGIPVTSWLAVD